MRYNCWILSDLTFPDLSGYSYSNRYRFEASDIERARVLAAQLASWHVAITGNNTIIERYRLRTDAQGLTEGFYSSSFGPGARVYPRGVVGNVPWCMMVNLYNGHELIGRKWLRLGFDKSDLDGQNFNAALVAQVQANYCDLLAGAGLYRTVSDRVINGARADPRLRLRVVRHGTNRRQLLVI